MQITFPTHRLFALLCVVLLFVTLPRMVGAYGQGSYYAEGTYYGQSTYYSQSAYTLTLITGVQFLGNLTVTNSVAKGSGTFVIDHPLAPRTKLLFHSFVESPDVKNIYDGTATLDENGSVVIRLPDYFDALNTDVRYQFFPLYDPMPDLHISEEEHDNQFAIAGGKPFGTISWQITGVRRDPFILKNPIITEVWKSEETLVKPGACIYSPLCK